ncbi:MAG: ATP-binding protein [Coriobacteriia bacterium]|nr:ATP-binding protein [Coriobacteriia bacterium]
MEAFFAPVRSEGSSTTDVPAVSAENGSSAETNKVVRQARIAIYDSPAAAPRIVDIHRDEDREFIEELSSHVYRFTTEMGGSIPFTVVREVVENLIHADFREVVVSILPGGGGLRFADQGPGIPDKERAMRPGFTTASAEMKRFIRGVGSGLPIVKEYLAHSGGSLQVEDNLGSGTVVTLRAGGGASVEGDTAPAAPAALVDGDAPTPTLPRLTLRQNRVLSLVMECGSAGPSLVSRELSVGLSTAYRDLESLEGHGLIVSDESGKRLLTELGTRYLDTLFG